MYTNVTTIRLTICSPSGSISSEGGRAFRTTPIRPRRYTATGLSLPSFVTSCNGVKCRSATRSEGIYLWNSHPQLPRIFFPIRRCENSTSSPPSQPRLFKSSSRQTHFPRSPHSFVFLKYSLVSNSSPPYLIRLGMNRLYSTSARCANRSCRSSSDALEIILWTLIFLLSIVRGEAVL